MSIYLPQLVRLVPCIINVTCHDLCGSSPIMNQYHIPRIVRPVLYFISMSHATDRVPLFLYQFYMPQLMWSIPYFISISHAMDRMARPLFFSNVTCYVSCDSSCIVYQCHMPHVVWAILYLYFFARDNIVFCFSINIIIYMYTHSSITKGENK